MTDHPEQESPEGRARGRDADAPTDIPPRGWKDIAVRTWKEAGDDNVGLISAGVAFYGFLALIPLIAAIVLTYGLVADPETVMRHVQGLFTLMPQDAARLIGDQMLSVSSTASHKTGIGLLVSILLSLYGAMKGASAIITALNIIYDEEEERGFIKKNLIALAATVGAALVALTGIAAISALAFVESLFPGAPSAMLIVIRIAFWIAAALAATAAIAALYRYGPSRDKAKWRWLTPGSLFGTLAWLAVTFGFGLYTASFGNYNATYGALGAVVVLLMWLYLSAYVLLLGAELNAEIEHQTARDTTRGPDRPMGARDAEMADTLGAPA
jgi:membrane protein